MWTALVDRVTELVEKNWVKGRSGFSKKISINGAKVPVECLIKADKAIAYLRVGNYIYRLTINGEKYEMKCISVEE